MATTTPTSLVERVLGRPEHPIDLGPLLERLEGEAILVTGAEGSIGSVVSELLPVNTPVLPLDIGGMDVRDFDAVTDIVESFQPSLVLHLAGAKHAPDGELDPEGTFLTNVVGTQNVLYAAGRVRARVVTASTCKACDPETVYGATKLLAERLTLHAGGSVARFFNVVESSGNVFRLWEGLDEWAAVPVTPCSRWFITLREAAALVVAAAVEPAGRYAVYPGERPRPMPSVAAALYPDRPQAFIPVRRGDRLEEPMHARSERVSHVNGWMWRVHSTHDAPEVA